MIREKTNRIKLLGILLAIGVFAAGCGGGEEATPKDPPAQEETAAPVEKQTAEKDVAMSDWEGIWNDMSLYLDDPILDTAFENLAESEGVTPEEAKAAYQEKRQCDFGGMIVQDEEVTFLDHFNDKDGKPIDVATYAAKGTKTETMGTKELTWYVFEAEEADAKYPVLLMIPVHGEEELTHFHLRYGDDVDSLLKKEGWFPTFVEPTATFEQLAEEIAE